MGQACSCRQPRGRKLQRRSSDASLSSTRLSGDAVGSDDDGGSDDGHEIDILIDDDMERDALLSSSSSSAAVAATRQSTSSAATMTKRTSKSQVRDDAALTMALPSRRPSPSAFAVVLQSDPKTADNAAAVAPLAEEQRQHLDALLRSYQRVTGVVDHGQLDLECVMCLDTFSDDNPKVRSLCNCGVNRTNFHLSCLLEWLDRDPNCPVCRAYLFYEEL
ncbi:hypothetical protein PINS_up005679 [Pythium insidiosum]|nr:hypothetical protein PINS_up005679 [Pythium insidiosum]